MVPTCETTSGRPPVRQIASAASLVMGQGNEAQPAVLVRGLAWTAPDNPAADLVRPAAEDMFR